MTDCRSRLIAMVSLLLLPLAISGGCQQSDGKVSVQGQVSFRGQALKHAALTFYPDIGRPETAAVEEGQYSTTLAPGNYTAVVLISPTLPPNYKEGDKVPPPEVVLPDAYASRMKSPLKATVATDQSEPINFDLK